MFSANPFYHELIRKYVIAFGTLFNDITVQRRDRTNNDTRVQTIAVPIAYGPQEKWLARIGENSTLEQSVAITLPRMGFEITSFNYSTERKLQSTKKRAKTLVDANNKNYQYVPVPYDLNFQLSIFVKNADDGAQIVEQILPYFTPDWTLQINTIPEMSIVEDIPFILQSVDLQDTYEGDFEERRALVWTMDFLCKAYFYGPIRTGGVIKRTQIDLAADTPITTPRSDRITLTPGLLANGSPTTNSSLSVSPSTITANDDFGFAFDYDFYADGLKYNPVSGSDDNTDN